MDQIVLSKFVSAEIHKSHIDSINLILEVLLYIFHCHILCFAKQSYLSIIIPLILFWIYLEREIYIYIYIYIYITPSWMFKHL